MTERRYCPLERMSRQYSVVFLRAERAEDAALHHLGEADDGVERRPQLVAHVGEELGFRAVRALGLRLLLEVAFGEVGELLRLQLQRLARFLQVRHRGDELPFGFDELLLVALQGRDVGADRDVAAVLGAAFVDLQPAPVAELAPRRCARRLVPLSPLTSRCWTTGRLRALPSPRRSPCPEPRAPARGRAGVWNFELQSTSRLSASHSTKASEIASTASRRRASACAVYSASAALLGDVDRDADEMLAGVVGIAHQLGAGAQPDPVRRRAADAEIVIDDRGFRRGEPVGQAVEVAVLADGRGR